MRTEEKKRDALRVKEQKNTPPGTPLISENSAPDINESKKVENESEASAETQSEFKNQTYLGVEHPGEASQTTADGEESSRAKDIPRLSNEVIKY